jgi:phage shock protein C
MRKRRLGKVVVGREVAGVCGGLADYCNMERGTFRALTVVGACVTAIFPFVIAYLVLAFVLPVRDDER